MFKSTGFLLILLVGAGLAVFVWEREVPACSRPIAYDINSFDSRFGLARQALIDALIEAEAVWEVSSGRDLFVYAPGAETLPINLVYDYRQEVTEALGTIESDIKEDEADYNALELRYLKLKVEYDALKTTYEASVAELNRKKRVTEFEFNQARSLEDELNGKVDELNTVADRLNRLANALNLNAEEYNITGAARGETYEGGVYFKSSEGEGINIYEFGSREKLVRLLAHELGHALGLEHIEDTDAIMYRLNKASASRVTTSDLAALEQLCNQN